MLTRDQRTRRLVWYERFYNLAVGIMDAQPHIANYELRPILMEMYKFIEHMRGFGSYTIADSSLRALNLVCDDLVNGELSPTEARQYRALKKEPKEV